MKQQNIVNVDLWTREHVISLSDVKNRINAKELSEFP